MEYTQGGKPTTTAGADIFPSLQRDAIRRQGPCLKLKRLLLTIYIDEKEKKTESN